jgi:homocysteine S-methyltransferase
MTLAERLNTEVLVCDGAMGTMLHAAGNSLDQALPGLNLTNPELVRAIHVGYVEAGVDIIQTNTFGGSRLRLAEYGLGERCTEINQAAVRIAREAAQVVDRPVLIAGSVSPAVNVQQRRTVGAAERADALRHQIETIVEAGVDLVLLETFGYLDELVEAAVIASTVAIPVIAQATFGPDARTLCGHTPQQVVDALAGTGITALGTNCVLGPQRTLQVLRELRRATSLPLTAQPNVGLPRRTAPARFEYDTDIEYFVRYADQLVESGASIVGGCCGTTPSTLAAVVETVERHRHRPRPAGGPAAVVTPVQGARVATAARPAEERRTVAVQVVAPEIDGLDELVRTVGDVVALGIDAVSVTPTYCARPRLSPVEVALHLHQRLGLEAMAGVSTWDRTSMVLQADLLGAHALGLRRIVCETGSPPLRGEYPHTDGIWDLDSVGLVELLRSLNDGLDYYGLAVPAKTEFEIGAWINPGAHDAAHELARAEAKLAGGVHFLVTRPVHEPSGLRRLLDAVGGRVPVLATIVPLTDFDRAEYLAHEVPDVAIPARTLEILHRAGAGSRAVGLDLAAGLVAEIAPLVDGLVLAPRVDFAASVRTLLGAAGSA